MQIQRVLQWSVTFYLFAGLAEVGHTEGSPAEESIQGEWTVEEMWIDGKLMYESKTRPTIQLRDARITGDILEIWRHDPEVSETKIIEWRPFIRVDASTNPKRINLCGLALDKPEQKVPLMDEQKRTAFPGKQGVYRIEGDILTICYPRDSNSTRLKTLPKKPDENTGMLVLKRKVKDK